MKKIITAAALVISLATVGSVFAGGHGQHRGDMGNRAYHQQLNDSRQQFHAAHKAEIKAIVEKKAELQALLSTATPDPVLAAKLGGELFSLRESLRSSAFENYSKEYGNNGVERIAYNKFMLENSGLRKQIASKRAEKWALIDASQPDLDKVGKVSGELFDLTTTLQEKAASLGFSRGYMRGDGSALGCGGRSGGHGNRHSGMGAGAACFYSN